MINLDIRKVHSFVSKQQHLGNDVRWDGWDIVFFRPVEHAIYSKDGVFRNGVWGFDNRVIVNSEGIWSIDRRNLKRPKPVRS